MRKAFALLFLSPFLLLACGRSSPTNYYLLESSLGSVQVDKMPRKSLRIAQVEIPAYLSRNNIVSRVKGETRLIVAEFHLWAEPVGNGVRRVVEEMLTPPLLKEGISVLPASTESRTDYTLLLDVQRLDGNFDEKAVLESRWTLLDANDRVVERGLFSAEEMVPGADYNVLVAAESKLLRDFGKYLAQKLPPLMASSGGRR